MEKDAAVPAYSQATLAITGLIIQGLIPTEMG
jgi:hypothetical protein